MMKGASRKMREETDVSVSHVTNIFLFLISCVCTLFHPILSVCAHGKLNFIHESLRHISWRFFFVFFASFCSLAAETLFFLPSFFCFSFQFQYKTPPSIHTHLTETKMYVRAKTKTSAIHNTGYKQNGTQLHCVVFRSEQMAFWFVLPSIFNHCRNHFSLPPSFS